MYKIRYSIDDENKGQVLGLYLTQEAAQHEADFLMCEIDEDGNPYLSPIDYHVEEIDQHDFQVRHQGIVMRCRKCHGEINNDPFPLFSDLKKLVWGWVIDPEDSTHDAGCKSLLLNHIPLPLDDSDVEV